MFSLALDEFVRENSVKLRFDTYSTYPVTQGNICRGVICESIGGAEHAAYVVQAADIVEDDDEGKFLRLVKRLDVHAVEFFNGEFAHNGYGILGGMK